MTIISDNPVLIIAAISAIGIPLVLVTILIGDYIKSSTWKEIERLIPTLIFISILAGVIYFAEEKLRDKDSMFLAIYRLETIPLFILICCLIISISISIVAWKQKGIGNLKKISERGLFRGLLFGVISGITVGAFNGIIIGNTSDFDYGLSFGIINALPITLLFGLIIGSMEEFEKDQSEHMNQIKDYS